MPEGVAGTGKWIYAPGVGRVWQEDYSPPKTEKPQSQKPPPPPPKPTKRQKKKLQKRFGKYRTPARDRRNKQQTVDDKTLKANERKKDRQEQKAREEAELAARQREMRKQIAKRQKRFMARNKATLKKIEEQRKRSQARMAEIKAQRDAAAARGDMTGVADASNALYAEEKRLVGVERKAVELAGLKRRRKGNDDFMETLAINRGVREASGARIGDPDNLLSPHERYSRVVAPAMLEDYKTSGQKKPGDIGAAKQMKKMLTQEFMYQAQHPEAWDTVEGENENAGRMDLYHDAVQKHDIIISTEWGTAVTKANKMGERLTDLYEKLDKKYDAKTYAAYMKTAKRYQAYTGTKDFQKLRSEYIALNGKAAERDPSGKVTKKAKAGLKEFYFLGTEHVYKQVQNRQNALQFGTNLPAVLREIERAGGMQNMGAGFMTEFMATVNDRRKTVMSTTPGQTRLQTYEEALAEMMAEQYGEVDIGLMAMQGIESTQRITEEAIATIKDPIIKSFFEKALDEQVAGEYGAELKYASDFGKPEYRVLIRDMVQMVADELYVEHVQSPEYVPPDDNPMYNYENYIWVLKEDGITPDVAFVDAAGDQWVTGDDVPGMPPGQDPMWNEFLWAGDMSQIGQPMDARNLVASGFEFWAGDAVTRDREQFWQKASARIYGELGMHAPDQLERFFSDSAPGQLLMTLDAIPSFAAHLKTAASGEQGGITIGDLTSNYDLTDVEGVSQLMLDAFKESDAYNFVPDNYGLYDPANYGVDDDGQYFQSNGKGHKYRRGEMVRYGAASSDKFAPIWHHKPESVGEQGGNVLEGIGHMLFGGGGTGGDILGSAGPLSVQREEAVKRYEDGQRRLFMNMARQVDYESGLPEGWESEYKAEGYQYMEYPEQVPSRMLPDGYLQRFGTNMNETDHRRILNPNSYFFAEIDGTVDVFYRRHDGEIMRRDDPVESGWATPLWKSFEMDLKYIDEYGLEKTGYNLNVPIEFNEMISQEAFKGSWRPDEAQVWGAAAQGGDVVDNLMATFGAAKTWQVASSNEGGRVRTNRTYVWNGIPLQISAEYGNDVSEEISARGDILAKVLNKANPVLAVQILNDQGRLVQYGNLAEFVNEMWLFVADPTNWIPGITLGKRFVGGLRSVRSANASGKWAGHGALKKLAAGSGEFARGFSTHPQTAAIMNAINADLGKITGLTGEQVDRALKRALAGMDDVAPDGWRAAVNDFTERFMEEMGLDPLHASRDQLHNWLEKNLIDVLEQRHHTVRTNQQNIAKLRADAEAASTANDTRKVQLLKDVTQRAERFEMQRKYHGRKARKIAQRESKKKARTLRRQARNQQKRADAKVGKHSKYTPPQQAPVATPKAPRGPIAKRPRAQGPTRRGTPRSLARAEPPTRRPVPEGSEPMRLLPSKAVSLEVERVTQGGSVSGRRIERRAVAIQKEIKRRQRIVRGEKSPEKYDQALRDIDTLRKELQGIEAQRQVVGTRKMELKKKVTQLQNQIADLEWRQKTLKGQALVESMDQIVRLRALLKTATTRVEKGEQVLTGMVARMDAIQKSMDELVESSTALRIHGNVKLEHNLNTIEALRAEMEWYLATGDAFQKRMLRQTVDKYSSSAYERYIARLRGRGISVMRSERFSVEGINDARRLALQEHTVRKRTSARSAPTDQPVTDFDEAYEAAYGELEAFGSKTPLVAVRESRIARLMRKSMGRDRPYRSGLGNDGPFGTTEFYIDIPVFPDGSAFPGTPHYEFARAMLKNGDPMQRRAAWDFLHDMASRENAHFYRNADGNFPAHYDGTLAGFRTKGEQVDYEVQSRVIHESQRLSHQGNLNSATHFVAVPGERGILVRKTYKREMELGGYEGSTAGRQYVIDELRKDGYEVVDEEPVTGISIGDDIAPYHEAGVSEEYYRPFTAYNPSTATSAYQPGTKLYEINRTLRQPGFIERMEPDEFRDLLVEIGLAASDELDDVGVYAFKQRNQILYDTFGRLDINGHDDVLERLHDMAVNMWELEGGELNDLVASWLLMEARAGKAFAMPQSIVDEMFTMAVTPMGVSPYAGRQMFGHRYGTFVKQDGKPFMEPHMHTIGRVTGWSGMMQRLSDVFRGNQNKWRWFKPARPEYMQTGKYKGGDPMYGQVKVKGEKNPVAFHEVYNLVVGKRRSVYSVVQEMSGLFEAGHFHFGRYFFGRKERSNTLRRQTNERGLVGFFNQHVRSDEKGRFRFADGERGQRGKRAVQDLYYNLHLERGGSDARFIDYDVDSGLYYMDMSAPNNPLRGGTYEATDKPVGFTHKQLSELRTQGVIDRHDVPAVDFEYFEGSVLAVQRGLLDSDSYKVTKKNPLARNQPAPRWNVLQTKDGVSVKRDQRAHSFQVYSEIGRPTGSTTLPIHAAYETGVGGRKFGRGYRVIAPSSAEEATAQYLITAQYWSNTAGIGTNVTAANRYLDQMEEFAAGARRKNQTKRADELVEQSRELVYALNKGSLDGVHHTVVNLSEGGLGWSRVKEFFRPPNAGAKVSDADLAKAGETTVPTPEENFVTGRVLGDAEAPRVIEGRPLDGPATLEGPAASSRFGAAKTNRSGGSMGDLYLRLTGRSAWDEYKAGKKEAVARGKKAHLDGYVTDGTEVRPGEDTTRYRDFGRQDAKRDQPVTGRRPADGVTPGVEKKAAFADQDPKVSQTVHDWGVAQELFERTDGTAEQLKARKHVAREKGKRLARQVMSQIEHPQTVGDDLVALTSIAEEMIEAGDDLLSDALRRELKKSTGKPVFEPTSDRHLHTRAAHANDLDERYALTPSEEKALDARILEEKKVIQSELQRLEMKEQPSKADLNRMEELKRQFDDLEGERVGGKAKEMRDEVKFDSQRRREHEYRKREAERIGPGGDARFGNEGRNAQLREQHDRRLDHELGVETAREPFIARLKAGARYEFRHFPRMFERLHGAFGGHMAKYGLEDRHLVRLLWDVYTDTEFMKGVRRLQLQGESNDFIMEFAMKEVTQRMADFKGVEIGGYAPRDVGDLRRTADQAYVTDPLTVGGPVRMPDPKPGEAERPFRATVTGPQAVHGPPPALGAPKPRTTPPPAPKGTTFRAPSVIDYIVDPTAAPRPAGHAAHTARMSIWQTLGMEEIDWYWHTIRRAKAEQGRKGTSKARKAELQKEIDLYLLAVSDLRYRKLAHGQHRMNRTPKEAQKLADSVADRVLGILPPKMMAFFADSLLGMGTEAGRALHVRLMNATDITGGLDPSIMAKYDPKHYDAMNEYVRAEVRGVQAERQRSLDLGRVFTEDEEFEELLAGAIYVDKNPVVRAAVKRGLKKYAKDRLGGEQNAWDLVLYARTRQLVGREHTKLIRSNVLLDTVGGKMDEFIGIRGAAADAESVNQVRQLLMDNPHMTVDEAVEYFTLDRTKTGKHVAVPDEINETDRVILEGMFQHWTGAKSMDKAEVRRALQANDTMPPFDESHNFREHQIATGEWSPKAVDEVSLTGGWSLEDERKWFEDRYGEAPPWTTHPKILDGSAFESLETYYEVMVETGNFNEMVRVERILSKPEAIDYTVLSEGRLIDPKRPELGYEVKPRKDWAEQREYMITRYGKLVSDDGIAFKNAPWLMNYDEIRVYRENNVGPLDGLISDPKDIERIKEVMGDFAERAADMLEEMYNMPPGTKLTISSADMHKVIFPLVVEMVATTPWLDVWKVAARNDSVLDMWAAYWRAMVTAHPGFVIANILDTPSKALVLGFAEKHRAIFPDDRAFRDIKGLWDIAIDDSSAYFTATGGRSPWERMRKGYNRRDKLGGAFDFATTGLARATLPKVERNAKLMVARQIYTGLWNDFGEDLLRHRLADGSRLTEEQVGLILKARVKDRINALFPTMDNAGPAERLLNKVFPFISYNFKNKVLWTSFLLDHPYLIYIVQRTQQELVEHNMTEWEKDHPGIPMPPHLAHQIRLPGTEFFLDIGQFTDAARGGEALFKHMTVGQFISHWLRPLPLQAAMFQRVVYETTRWGGQRVWQKILRDDGTWDEFAGPNGDGLRLVDLPPNVPFDNRPLDVLDFFGPVQDWVEAGKDFMSEGNFLRLMGDVLTFGRLGEPSTFYVLSQTYRIMRDADEDAARKWLLETDSGAQLQEYWNERYWHDGDPNKGAAMQNTRLSEFTLMAARGELPDNKALALQFLLEQPPDIKNGVFASWNQMAILNDSWDAILDDIPWDDAESREHAWKVRETMYALTYHQNPFLYTYEAMSQAAEDVPEHMMQIRLDSVRGTFYDLFGWDKRPTDPKELRRWLEEREAYLDAYPEMAHALSDEYSGFQAARNAQDKVWKASTEALDVADKVAEVARQLEDWDTVNATYKHKAMASLVFNSNITGRDRKGKPKFQERLSIRKIRGGESPGRVHYGARMAGATRAATDKDGNFDAFKWWKTVDQQVDLRDEYFERNKGARQNWVVDGKIAQLKSRFGVHAKAERWDKAWDVYDAAPDYLRERWREENPTEFARWEKNSRYSGYMQKWIAYFDRNDNAGATRYFNSLPKWVQDRYYENNPGKTMSSGRNVQYISMLDKMFSRIDAGDWDGAEAIWKSAPAYMRSMYYANNPDSTLFRGSAYKKGGTGSYSGKSSASLTDPQFKKYTKMMGKWVKLMKDGQEQAAKDYFRSLPKWAQDFYLARNPDKALMREDDRMQQLMQEYLLIPQNERDDYLAQHPQLAQWMNENDSQGARMNAIRYAYANLPDDPWLKRVFREKYPEVFSKEAEGQRKIEQIMGILDEHPDFQQPWLKWYESIAKSMQEALQYMHARPKTPTMDYSRVQRLPRGLSAEEVAERQRQAYERTPRVTERLPRVS